jgi:hypothetical protein
MNDEPPRQQLMVAATGRHGGLHIIRMTQSNEKRCEISNSNYNGRARTRSRFNLLSLSPPSITTSTKTGKVCPSKTRTPQTIFFFAFAVEQKMPSTLHDKTSITDQDHSIVQICRFAN